MEESMKTGGFLFAVMTAAALLCSCSLLPTEEEFDTTPVVKEYEGNNYNKYTVVRGDMVQKESVIVRYQGTARTEIKGEGIGVQIKKFCVKKGQKVEAGDVLIENYLPQQENIIKKSKREIQKLNLQIQQAQEMQKLELKKIARLSGSRAQKKNIRQQYQSQIQNYKSSLALLKLDVKAAKEELDLDVIPAETDGRVTSVDTSFEGGFATEEDVLLVIEGKKKNRFRAKTSYASRFHDGEEVTVSVGGQLYKTKVKKTSSKNLVYFYPKTTLSLKSGTAGSIDLILKEKKDVLYVPAALVYDMGDKKIVYVEDENGVKTIREVTLGERIDNLVEITDGLQEMEQIITS
jgi:multidrug efflux pump subunit AcrA (membrane-fusion protein)